MLEVVRSRLENLVDVLRQLVTKLRFSLELKVEQREMLNSLLDGSDVLDVLPTGYGKSLIFQLLVLVGKEERRKPSAVLVICPLKSIIDDQIGEAEGLGIRAVAINDVSSDDLRSDKFQLIFGSAESVLEKRVLDVLKEPNSTYPHIAPSEIACSIGNIDLHAPFETFSLDYTLFSECW